MRELIFTAQGQRLVKQGDFSGIAAGSKGYLRCRVNTADADWLRANKAMLFNGKYAVAVGADSECAVPDEVTDDKSFKVQLVGQRGKTRMTTNHVLIEQVR